MLSLIRSSSGPGIFRPMTSDGYTVVDPPSSLEVPPKIHLRTTRWHPHPLFVIEIMLLGYELRILVARPNLVVRLFGIEILKHMHLHTHTLIHLHRLKSIYSYIAIRIIQSFSICVAESY